MPPVCILRRGFGFLCFSNALGGIKAARFFTAVRVAHTLLCLSYLNMILFIALALFSSAVKFFLCPISKNVAVRLITLFLPHKAHTARFLHEDKPKVIGPTELKQMTRSPSCSVVYVAFAYLHNHYMKVISV